MCPNSAKPTKPTNSTKPTKSTKSTDAIVVIKDEHQQLRRLFADFQAPWRTRPR